MIDRSYYLSGIDQTWFFTWLLSRAIKDTPSRALIAEDNVPEPFLDNKTKLNFGINRSFSLIGTKQSYLEPIVHIFWP